MCVIKTISGIFSFLYCDPDIQLVRLISLISHAISENLKWIIVYC